MPHCPLPAEDSAIEAPQQPPAHILVCLSGAASDAALLRYTAQLAKRMDGGFSALHIETVASPARTAGRQDHLAEAFRLAESLGGKTIQRPGEDVAAEILTFARLTGATDIVIGKSRRRFPLRLGCGPTLRVLRGFAGGIVHVPAVTASGQARPPRPERPWPINPLSLLGSLAAIALLTKLCLLNRDAIEPATIGIIYLTSIVVIAISLGLFASIFASIISVLAFDYFFFPPLYSLRLDRDSDIICIVLFLLSSVMVSGLAARTRAQVLIARNRTEVTAALYQFARQLAGLARDAEVAAAAAAQLAEMLNTETLLFLAKAGRLEPAAAAPAGLTADAATMAIARRTWQDNRPIGSGDRAVENQSLSLPLSTSRGPVGVLVLRRPPPRAPLQPHERRLAEALADLISVAIDRTLLAEEIEEARQWRETERLRSALLTSLSHDFRTPLTSILGALSSLRANGTDYQPEEREELLATAQEEAEQLNRFINNLLDMTQMSSGKLNVRREPVYLDEIVASAVRRAAKVAHQHPLHVVSQGRLPLLSLDPVLTEQVIFNLIDNAAKYTPPNSPIDLHIQVTAETVSLAVRDCGPGIPQADLERVFDKFYRVTGEGRHPSGTGLGLAICRGFVEAQGGRIGAENRTDRSGAVFTLTFPTDTDSSN